jgi:hypothetical protein
VVVVTDGKTTQTIGLSADAQAALEVVPGVINSFIIDHDINFDGHNDAAVLTGTGYNGVNNMYDYYIFNPQTNLLEKNATLVEVSNPKIDVAKKQIISSYRSGPQWYTQVFQFTGTGYTKGASVAQVETVASSGAIVAFENAINTGNWVDARKYLADEVYLILGGSECCGPRTADKSIEYLSGSVGHAQFTFNQESSTVKNYLAYEKTQYPSGHQLISGVYLTDLPIGVEQNVTQDYKGVIAYRVKNGKVDLLYIDPALNR